MRDEKNKIEISDSEEDSASLELVVGKTNEDEKNPEIAADRNIYDFDLETMKDKPWLKPGANMTDYFNYGFTEQTWKKYCEMQKQNRAWANKMNKNNDGRLDKEGKWHNYDDRRMKDDDRRRRVDDRWDRDNEKRGRYDNERGYRKNQRNFK